MNIVLIIGGAGFIGRQLAIRHLAMNDMVIVLDNETNSLGRLTGEGTENYVYVPQPVEVINELPFEGNFDIVYHLASESRPSKFHDKHRDIISSNVVGLIKVLTRINEKTKLVYASSSEIYGDNHKMQEDSYSIIQAKHPRNIYSISKMMGESILQNNLEYNWNIVRFFNVYGPVFRSDDDKVIPNLVRAKRNGTPFTIFGDGSQVRSFTHISDVVEGLVRITNSSCKHETFNLGNDEEITIKDLAQFYNPEGEIIYEEKRAGEPQYRKPDCSHAKEMLGWEANVELRDGLKDL